MDDTRRRRRLTIRALMIATAIIGLACFLLRPFVISPPPPVEVIGLDFDMQEKRMPDGSLVMGLPPKMTVKKVAKP